MPPPQNGHRSLQKQDLGSDDEIGRTSHAKNGTVDQEPSVEDEPIYKELKKLRTEVFAEPPPPFEVLLYDPEKHKEVAERYTDNCEDLSYLLDR